MQVKPTGLWYRLFAGMLLYGYALSAQGVNPAMRLKQGLWHGQQHELRYHPEGEDFVITNGNRRFNRALYGTNTAFRVEAGDLPEFALYMPGMGGNLKFGLIAPGGTESKWLISAKQITARYTPGRMGYEITDPLLGSGKLHVTVLALANAEGIVVKTWLEGKAQGVKLIYAFGGASGEKFSRSGDMGPDPESSFYLKPENCLNNNYQLTNRTFNLTYGKGTVLQGVFPSDVKLADASRLASPIEFYQSKVGTAPVITGVAALKNKESLYFLIKGSGKKEQLPAEAFIRAENAREQIAGRVKLGTPDPYINTLGAALSIASDAIWESPSYLHGAVGWRIRLNGWRGAYTADPLGWHDRARTHFEAYEKSQVTEPSSGPVVADTTFHLSRQQEKMGTSLFSSGYISRDPEGKSIRPHHYDMNLVYIDELLWHFNWTGDLDFVKKMWPVIQRHLAWEKRNFDPDNDGLYDAYAAIWASDALYYGGGAVTHSTAYNYRANVMAARIAQLINEDPVLYQKEAAKILNAVNHQLWMPGKGAYAEYKDVKGLRNNHPAAALWTIYHSIDSDLPDPFQAYQSLRYIDQEIPHLPISSPGLPAGKFYTLSTSNWMPYTWSINNVAMAEVMHTALANWEAGRNEEAFTLFKSEILADMYFGGSPGNFVQISYYDAARGEAYRDFADPVGISSRALVSGLFGILPDALAHTLVIKPGFPAAWNHAAIHIPDLDEQFNRNGVTDHYRFKLSFATPLALKLEIKARGTAVSSVEINGKKGNWKNKDKVIGGPMIEINAPAAKIYDVKVVWKGKSFEKPVLAATYAVGDLLQVNFGQASVLKVNDPQQVFSAIQFKAGRFKARLSGKTGNHTAFVQLKQGELTWWYPLCFELKKAISVLPEAGQEANKLVFKMFNNSNQQITGTIRLGREKATFTLNPKTLSRRFILKGSALVAGTNPVLFTAGNGKTDTLAMNNWNVDLKQLKQQTINLSSVFNARVTDIFNTKYLKPRPATATLQIPWQGIGDWTSTKAAPVIDDAGLRKLAGAGNEILTPQGIRFLTPGIPGTKNIVFTSLWDNYPDHQEIPLSGQADHAYFLMAGSTNPMQSQFDNGKIVVTYTDGSSTALTLRNPETWWPIQEDYYTDGFAFNLKTPRPPRVHLKTGMISSGKTGRLKPDQQTIDGGAATLADLPLDGTKTLKSLRLTTLANDVVTGLMAITLIQQ